MINFLLKLGLNENEIKNIIEFNSFIIEEDNKDIEKIVFLLKSINMNENNIKELVISNPMVLNRTYEDIYNLILKLKEYKFDSINYLLEANPYFINYDVYEIENYYNSKENSIEEVTEMIENNPFIIEEED